MGSVPIRAYALCIIVGIVVALWITKRRYVARGRNGEEVYDAALVAVPAGIIGGRLYHVITDNEKYFCDTCHPVDALKITNGGLGIWGAVALGTLAVYILFRYRGRSFSEFADAAAPGVVLAQAIGRLGNWFNQELYGRETTVPWGLEIYNRLDSAGHVAPLTGHSTGQVLAVVHPTFLYEMVWNVVVFVALLWFDRHRDLVSGQLFALYVAGYTAGRFVVELMRSDEATHILGLRVNTIVSAVVCASAIAVFYGLRRRSRSRTSSSAVDEGAPLGL